MMLLICWTIRRASKFLIIAVSNTAIGAVCTVGIINTVLGVPFGFVIYFAYLLTSSYGLAIVIFAMMVKVIMFPVSVLAHKNSIRLLQLQPSLGVIKQRCEGDKERLNEEQYELFKKERYNPVLGMVPLFIQLFLVTGVLQVMYHPLQHLLRLDSDVIYALGQAVRTVYGGQSNTPEQLLVMSAFGYAENLPVFRQALAGFSDADNIMYLISSTNMSFMGLNLGAVPSFRNPSIELVLPFLSGIIAMSFCLIQKALSPGALSQGERTNLGFTVFTVVLSVYFALVLPVGVGIYWAVGNLAAICVVFVLYTLNNPKKLAAEALVYINANRKSPSQIKDERLQKKALSIREKQDTAKFNTAKKQLVFYALSGGQYKFYKKIIEHVLKNSQIIIHYLTNDPNDSLFQMKMERLIPYYVGHRRTISVMLKLDTDIFITTVPGLQKYHLKRSVVRDDIEYIHTPHSMGSTIFAAKEGIIDHIDTFFCVGSHHIAELRRREEMVNIPRRTLVKAGYGLFDQLLEAYAALPKDGHEKPRILIAPSWQTDNILDLCIDRVIDALSGKGYVIIVRPHTQYTRMFPKRMELLIQNYSKQAAEGEVVFDLDFSSNQSIFLSDIVITDWSNITFEFSFCTLKPSIHINTPMKVLNPNYEKYELEISDISLRDKIGVSIDVDSLENLGEVTAKLLAEKNSYKEQIEQVKQQYLYHPGRNGEAGGSYIIKQLSDRQK